MSYKGEGEGERGATLSYKGEGERGATLSYKGEGEKVKGRGGLL